jgi:hypothetical protein
MINESENKIRLLVRKRIHELLDEMTTEEIDEISTSGGAGAFLTPMAFRGNKKAAKDKEKNTAQQA